MNIDQAIELLQSQGYEVRQKRKIIYDSSFLGLEARGERLDSAASNTITKDNLEQLKLDAQNARNEMISSIDPNAATRNNDYAGKSNEALRDIAQAHKDAYCERVGR